MTTFPDFVNVDYFSDIGRTVAQTDVPSEARAAIDAVGAQPPAGTPTAVACFIFDDCPVEDYTAVKPILDGKGVKGGFAFPSNYPGSNAQYMSWANVQALQAAGHEILSHSLNHGHLDTFADPDMSLETTIANINNKAAYEAHGITIRGHAYTFGEHNATIRRLVRDYYEYAFGTTTNGASGSQDPLSTYAIRRIAIKDSTVTATHYAQIDTAITNGELIAFIIHANPTAAEFTSGGGGHTRLADVIQYCLDNDVPVVTPGEAFDRCRNILDAGDYPGGASYSVISREGRAFVPGAGDTHVLPYSSDALTKTPAVFNEGITYQKYQSSSGAPGGGPGTVETVIVDTTATMGGLNFQRYMRNGGNGTYLRNGLTDNTGWTAWRKLVTLADGTITSSATPTINVDNYDQYIISALAEDITGVTISGSGTPVEGQRLRVSITGTASRAITWGSSFEAGPTVPLPTGVTGTSRYDFDFAYNSATSKWRIVGGVGTAATVHAASAKTTLSSNDELPVVDSDASYGLKNIKYSDLLAGLVDPDALTSGESTLSRRAIMNGATLTSGIVRLTYFTARKTETINSVRVGTHTTAAGATPTLCRIGIYSVDGSGNLTLVASTANDTALFAAASTTYTKALSASWSKTAGQRYAVGVLVVTGATAPTIQGQILSIADELAQAPRLCGARSGQSDLPSSISVGNVADATHQCYVAMVP